MPTEPTEKDLLLPFESKNLTGDYKEFFKTKRNNFFAIIQRFPKLWAGFQSLDEIWMRGIGNLQGLREVRQMFPALLFMHAHLKYRVAGELAFSCCMAEAWGTLRVGIESVGYAHKLYREPHLTEVWLSKDDGKAEAKAFKKAFLHDRARTLFPPEHGLAELHKYWQNYSDWGSHTSLAAMSLRFRQEETPEKLRWHLDYFEAKDTRIVTSIYSLLDASWHMERPFFDVFKIRFNLDAKLATMRDNFERQHKALARDIQRKYGPAIIAEAYPGH